MSKKPEDSEKRLTLTDDQIASNETTVGRRSAIKALGAAVLGASATSLTGCIVTTPARPVAYQSGITDGDGGRYADPAGAGRGPRRAVATGITDADSAAGGQMQDAGGYGRGHHGQAGWQSGLTDSDTGSYADPAGNGRGTGRLGYTGITDSDGGQWADQAGHGRGRWR